MQASARRMIDGLSDRPRRARHSHPSDAKLRDAAAILAEGRRFAFSPVAVRCAPVPLAKISERLAAPVAEALAAVLR
jgi:hypothetical protein